MIRRRTGNGGRSQYRHKPNAARKRREEIRKRARPYIAILNDLREKVPDGFIAGSIMTASDDIYALIFPGKNEMDARKWMVTVEEEGFDGWDHRGNLLHIMPSEITEIKIFINDHRS